MTLAVMAKGKKPPTRKSGSTDKSASQAKPRKSSIKKSAAKPGKGHNKPPPDRVPPHPKAQPVLHSGWQTDTTGEIARHMATRQRHFRAAIGIGTPTTGTPHAQAHDPTYLHQVMLRRIASLEETFAKLAALSDAEQIKPRPLDESEIEEIRDTLVWLKALPPAPTRQPTDLVEAESKLAKFGEKVLVGLTVWAATKVASPAATALWASCSAQLKTAAQAIGEWYANLPLPPP
jgi:hypothetical protein